MKDSNGVGEGPYTMNDLWLVYGPKGPLSGNIGHANEIRRLEEGAGDRMKLNTPTNLARK